MATGGLNLSREFFELLKAIGESKSKQEEDRIISREVARLKHKMETPPTNQTGMSQNMLVNTKKQQKEFLVRLLYVSMLGHDNSWGLIRAVELAASASLYHKRTGYLVCGACLPPDHEFRFMLVNQMQRDLQSSNILECCGGVLACTTIITADMVPAVAGEVSKLLQHESATLRKKAIIALHRFYQLAPEVMTREELRGHLERALCDKDPAVMGSSLNVIEAVAVVDPASLKHIVPSLVAILKQIGDRRLPAEYDYHRLPAPWMQLKIVRILGYLGKADAQASQGMYEIVADCMKKADTGINAGYAVVYECVKTIVTIYPNNALLEAAASAISRFIQSRSHNLRYLGVTGLAMIVEQHPQYAAQHQIAVMDCLEDPDETLQRKTLDLLYRMTNPVNVEFITEKLVHFLSGTTDLFLKKVLTDRICSVAERYAPSNAWYIQSITKLFEVSGDMVKPEVAQNLMSLLAEGTGADDEEADMLLRQNAVELYVSLLPQQEEAVTVLPRILLETMAWVLGEYGYLSAVESLPQVLDHLCTLANHSALLSSHTRQMLVQAIMKLVAQAGNCPPKTARVIDEWTKSREYDLQHRCLEFQHVLTHCPELLPEVFPVDASAEDVQVDENLSFLDGYVQHCLSEGARPYNKPEDDDDDDDDDELYYGSNKAGGSSTFNMTPYEKPQTPAHGSVLRQNNPAGVVLPPGAAGTGSLAPTPVQQAKPGEPSLNTRHVANVWGKGGLSSGGAAPPAQAAAPPTNSSWGQPAQSSHPGAVASCSSYGSASTYGAPIQPAVQEKTPEQLERERQAAALFGGIASGSGTPTAPVVPAAQAAAGPAPPPAPPSAPAPAAEVDLLDMSMWDTPDPAESEVVPTTSVFDAAPLPGPVASPLVETVSDDNMGPHPVAETSTPVSAAALDPFAAVLGEAGVSDKPLDNLPAMNQQSRIFEFNGTPMGPLPIDTAQFGAKWGSCPATAPVSVTSSTTTTLEQFMEVCTSVGAHKVEVIAASNEGICAGQLSGGTQVVLLHGKISPQPGGGAKLDVTIKSSDRTLAGSLAMYVQQMLR